MFWDRILSRLKFYYVVGAVLECLLAFAFQGCTQSLAFFPTTLSSSLLHSLPLSFLFVLGINPKALYMLAGLD